MILWLNGAFGSGKTTAAYELNRRLPDSLVFDPESFGFCLFENIPEKYREQDFQDLPLWRETNRKMLEMLAGLTLNPSDGSVKKRWERVKTWFRHIRT